MPALRHHAVHGSTNRLRGAFKHLSRSGQQHTCTAQRPLQRKIQASTCVFVMFHEPAPVRVTQGLLSRAYMRNNANMAFLHHESMS
jgi:hypothetical protein